jgi:peroxiredoxin
MTAVTLHLKKIGKWLLHLAEIVLAIWVILVLLQRQGFLLRGPASETASPTNRTLLAADFSLPDLEGGWQRLSHFRGQVVLVNFWATWCPPCRAEMPSMEALYQTYRDQGFTILAVSIDVQGAAAVQPFLEQYRLTFPVLLDPKGQVTGAYGVRSLPTTYLLDRQGRVVSREIGARNWANAGAQALIASLLEEPAQASQESRADSSPILMEKQEHATRDQIP